MTTPPQPSVMIAYDGSSAATEAIRRLAELVPGARTLVVTAWESAARAAGAGAAALPGVVIATAVKRMDAEAEREAQDTADAGAAVAAEHGLVATSLAVRADCGIAAALSVTATEQRVAAVVIAPHHSPIERVVLGGVTAGLMRRAPCPVVVVGSHRRPAHPSQAGPPEPVRAGLAARQARRPARLMWGRRPAAST